MQRLPYNGDDPVRGLAVGLAVVVITTIVFFALRGSISSAVPALVFALGVAVSGGLGGKASGASCGFVAGVMLAVFFERPNADLPGAVEVVASTGLLVAFGAGFAHLAQISERTEQTAEEAGEDLAVLSQHLASVSVDRSALAEKAESLQERELQRTALLRWVSHDLRTPLSSVRAVVTDLREGVVYDRDTSRELLDTVCDEVDRLDRMVSNLLSMSRIEAGSLDAHFQAVDIEELVRERLDALKPLFRDVVARTSFVDDLPLVLGDYSLLEEVFTNLIANAVRHSPPDADVWVVVGLVLGEDGRQLVKVEISDRGAGVDKQDEARIFEPFERGEGSKSTGLGLAICRSVIEMHGGTIWVQRTFGGGATFCFTLQLHPETGASVPALVADIAGDSSAGAPHRHIGSTARDRPEAEGTEDAGGPPDHGQAW